MKKRSIYLLTLLLFELFSFRINAQTNAYYSYIYRLDKEQVIQIQENRFNYNYLYSPIDSCNYQEYNGIASKLNNLPYGNYLVKETISNGFSYKLKTKLPFQLYQVNDYPYFSIKLLSNKNNEVIRNAIVQIHAIQIPFNDSTQTYSKVNTVQEYDTFNNIVLTILHEGEIYFFKLGNYRDSQVSRTTYRRVEFFESTYNKFIRPVLLTFPFRIVTVFSHNTFCYLRAVYEKKHPKLNQYGEVIERYPWHVSSEKKRDSSNVIYPKWNYFNFHRRNFLTGYIALNKPEYLPQDTLKLKAFINRKRGRKYNQSILVKLITNDPSNQNRTIVFTKKIKPNRRGDYQLNLPISDSLKLNQLYTLLISTKYKQEITSKSFYIKDYQLNEVTFNMDINSSSELAYHKNQTITLTFKAQVINGFPVNDGKIHLKINTVGYSAIQKKTFIPKILLEKEFELDPSIENSFTIPNHLLPDANINLEISATFTNTNNEIHTVTKYIHYTNNPLFISSKQTVDQLTLELVENAISIPGQGKLIGYQNQIKTLEKTIDFPTTLTLDKAINTYKIEYAQLSKTIQIPHNIEIHSTRTKDSVKFEVHNPHNIPIYYTIFKDKNLFYEQGTINNSTTKSFHSSDKHVYCMSYHFIWNNQLVKNVSQAIYKSNNLNIQIENPEIIRPGDKVDFTLKVTDANNKPQKKIQLSAGAINAQFKNDQSDFFKLPLFYRNQKAYRLEYIYTSENPYTSLYHDTLEYGSWNRNLQNSEPVYLKTVNTETHYSKYNHLKNTEDAICMHYDTISNTSNYQFTPLIFNAQKNLVPIKTIYIDGKLTHLNAFDTDSGMDYPVIVFPKKTPKNELHTIELWTKNKIYTLKKIRLKKGVKLTISFAENIENKDVTIKEITNELLEKQKNATANTTFRCIVPQGTILHVIQNKDTLNYKQLVNRDDHYANDYCEFGPVNTGNIQVILNFNTDKIQTIKFDPKYIYKFTQDSVVKIPDTYKERDRNYFETNLELDRFYTKSAGNIWFPKITKEASNEPFFPDYNVRKSSFECSIRLDKDNFIFKDLKYVCLIDKHTHEQLRIYRNMPYLIQDLDTGNYKLLLIKTNNQQFTIDSMHIPTIGSYFIPLDSSPIVKNNVKERLDLYAIDLKGIQPNLNQSSLAGNFKLTTAKEIYTLNLIQNDSIIKTIHSNKKGLFQLTNITPGTYLVKITNQQGTLSITEHIEFIKNRITVIKDITLNKKSLTVLYTSNYRYTPLLSDAPSASSILSSNTEKPYIRSNFKDDGFWSPTLITNRKGEVKFSVPFPDNITKWNVFAFGMDGLKTGIGKSEIKSYNTVNAALITPRFLIAGDSVAIVGKINNHHTQKIDFRSTFTIDSKIGKSTDSSLIHGYSETFALKAPYLSDSLHCSYVMHSKTGEKDGEKRSIPIYPSGTIETRGQFHLLSKDTTLKITNLDTSLLALVATNNPLPILNKQIEDLEAYPYLCMEQCASKLLGLLAKKKIKSALNEVFTPDNEIKRLIDLIDAGMNDSKSWGWWKNTNSNPFMTSYVLSALHEAANQGFKTKDYKEAIQYLQWNLNLLEGDQFLHLLLKLSEMNQLPNKSTYIEIAKKTHNLSAYQSLLLTRIRQLNGEKVSIPTLLKKAKQTQFGNLFWGEDRFNFYENRHSATLLAYEIIRAEDSNSVYLPKIRNYFMESRSTSYNLNTIDKAQLLKTILPDYLKEYKNFKAPVQLTITGGVNQVVTEFPFKTVLKKGSELSIQKSGAGTVYLTTYQKHWNENPSITDSVYKITSSFTQHGKIVDTLTAGVIAQLNVEIEVKKQGDYVFVEIPIPAGCSYDNNEHQRTYLESHREYFKNKTNIYYENLPVGKHRITIHVQPRFTGTFTLNPVKVERMYFPIFFGRNETKKIVQRNKN